MYDEFDLNRYFKMYEEEELTLNDYWYESTDLEMRKLTRIPSHRKSPTELSSHSPLRNERGKIPSYFLQIFLAPIAPDFSIIYQST